MLDRRYIYLAACIVALICVTVGGAIYYTNSLESELRRDVQNILNDAGYHSVNVYTDGTKVTLSGSLPTITQREKAFRLAVSNKRVSSVQNRITVIPVGEVAQSTLALEIQNSGVQLVLSGQIPSKVAQLRLRDRAESLSQEASRDVLDLLINRDRRGYDRFVEAAFAGLEAVSKLDIGQARIDEININVSGEAKTAEQHQAALAMLNRLTPDGYSVQFNVDAPLPTVSPYIFSMSQESGRYTLQACHAPNEETRDIILESIKKFTDLTQNASCTLAIGQPNDVWDQAVSGGLQGLQKMSSGLLYIVDNNISVTGFARESEEPTLVSDLLNQTIPADYALKTSIRPWYPLAEEYKLTLEKQEGRVVSVSGNAPSQEGIDRLIEILGASPELASELQLARGTPENWQIAVDLVLEAVEGIPTLTVLFDNQDITLRGDLTTAIKQRVSTALSRKLPEGYTLSFENSRGLRTDPNADGSPYWFTVSQTSAVSDIILEGVVPDSATQKALALYASSSFTEQRIQDNMRMLELDSIPGANWFSAATGMIDALKAIDRGTISLKNNRILIDGQSVEPTTRADIQRFFKQGVLENFELDIDLVLASGSDDRIPSMECVRALNSILAQSPIKFAPGSIEMDPSSQTTISDLAKTYQTCIPTDLEIGGHTDNTGAPDLNMELSFKRARSVLEAMVTSGVSPSRLTAVGYGEANPIASNETPEGQQKNRRFEFKLKE